MDAMPLPPKPSPVPLPRGLYERDDPDDPERVITELWTSDGLNVGCSRLRRDLYEALYRNALRFALNEIDPHPRAISAGDVSVHPPLRLVK